MMLRTRAIIIIGASLSEPHLVVTDFAINISYIRPFGPGWVPVNALRANGKQVSQGILTLGYNYCRGSEIS